MRETQFIEDNKKKWKEYEKVLDKEYQNPDKLNEIFITVTDDLSYARTFYKNRSVRVYLNGLAQKIFQNVYRNKRSPTKRFANFWKEELPMLVYEARYDLRLSFLVFMGAVLIGVLSTAMDIEFPRIILGDEYVDMTLENIEKGDPMGVYKDSEELGMSAGITLNNIQVALLTFVLGAFFSIGSIIILIKNGVMLGAFQYFFYAQGVFQESFLTIWMHGTLEISAIVIAGAAGITMGKGFVFPGTLSRTKSFQITARRGLKIMVGLIPIFIIAGFIEGFITRHTEVPDIIRLFFILACLAFILGYFVWYPRHKAQTGFNVLKSRHQLQPDSDQNIHFGKIKTVGELFADGMGYYRDNFWKVFVSASLAALFYGVATITLHEADNFSDLFVFNDVINNIGQYFRHSQISILPLLIILTFTGISIFFNQAILKKANVYIQNPSRFAGLFTFLKAFSVLSFLYVLLYYSGGAALFVVWLVSPIIFLWLFTMQKEEVWHFKGLAKTFKLMSSGYMNLVILMLLLLVLCGLFFFMLNTGLVQFLVDNIVKTNLPVKGITGKNILHIVMMFTTIFALFLLVPLVLISVNLYGFSQTEIKEANHLKQRIQQIGKKKEIRGLAMESNS